MTILKSREGHLRRTYNLTLEQYNKIVEDQGHRCPICLKHKTSFKTNLAVDHDHRTLEIYGACCNWCNHRFIGRNRNWEMYARAAEYLKKGLGLFAPAKRKATKARAKSAGLRKQKAKSTKRKSRKG